MNASVIDVLLKIQLYIPPKLFPSIFVTTAIEDSSKMVREGKEYSGIK